jgi:hypothetical protein
VFRAVRVLLAVACFLAIAGCSFDDGEEESTFAVGQLRSLVLQPSDVPRVFVRFDEGRQISADQPPGRSDPGRFGRERGWKARYRRPGSPRTRGPLVIESRADVFESSKGAEDELEAAESELGSAEDEETTPWEPVDAPTLGDDSFVMSGVQQALGGGVRFYLIAWREDNLTASILANGFDRGFTVTDALRLARRQQARIASARRG